MKNRIKEIEKELEELNKEPLFYFKANKRIALEKELRILKLKLKLKG